MVIRIGILKMKNNVRINAYKNFSVFSDSLIKYNIILVLYSRYVSVVRTNACLGPAISGRYLLREATKKSYFFNDTTILRPYPSSLVATFFSDFFSSFKKVLFS